MFFCLFSTISLTAFSWGSATHVYIADHIGKRLGLRNTNEMYGAVAPDIFNYMFGLEYAEYLHDQTHGVPPNDEDFLKLWWEAKNWNYQKSAAYGFVCHNDVWAADFTAHHSARTLSGPWLPPGYDPGWVIIKAAELESFWGLSAYLAPKLHSMPPGFPGTSDQFVMYIALEICHNVIEAAGDVVLKDMDPQIGLKISLSALLRTHSFPSLLVDAYAGDLSSLFGMSGEEAAQVIIDAEKEFRQMMIMYGAALMQDKETAKHALAQQMAELAQAYIGSYFTLPPYEEILGELDHGMSLAVAVCEAGDCFRNEVQETIKFVRWNLLSHQIWYW